MVIILNILFLLGTISARNSITILPAATPPIVISRYTLGLVNFNFGCWLGANFASTGSVFWVSVGVSSGISSGLITFSPACFWSLYIYKFYIYIYKMIILLYNIFFYNYSWIIIKYIIFLILIFLPFITFPY